MSKEVLEKFAYCAIAFIGLLLLVIYGNKNNSETIGIAKNQSTQNKESVKIVLPSGYEEYAGGSQSSNNSSNSNTKANGSSSDQTKFSFNIGYVDITKTQIILPSRTKYTTPSNTQTTSTSNPSSTQTGSVSSAVPKTPTIDIMYRNDSVSVVISGDSIKSFTLYRKTNDGTYNQISVVSGKSYTDANISDGNSYTYKATCTRENGTKVYSSISSIKIQSVKSIYNFSAKSKLNELVLSWQKVSGASYYVVYRKASDSFTKIASTSSLTYSDKGLKSNTSYTYKIYAFDSNNNKIAASSGIAFRTLYVPSAPLLKLYSNDEYGVQIYWTTDSSANSYNVYKYINGKYVLVKNTKNNFYIDEHASGTCVYAVTAVGNAGESEKSNKITVVAK